MEKFKSIIESSIDNSKNFDNIEEELLYYQLEYFERVEKGIIKPLHEKTENSDESMESYIYESSEYVEYLTNEYRKKRGDGMFKNEDERKSFEGWKGNILKEIIDDYKSGNKKWRETAILKIQNSLKELELNLNKETEENKEKDEYTKKAGLIDFNMTSSMDDYNDFGIREGDDCISIHFPNLFTQKDKNEEIVNIFSGESLSKLAVRIVEEFPQTKAILAQSWMVGSPVGKRVGFFVYREHKDQVVGGGRFWGQFIDENGEIKDDDMKNFLETGIPKYYLSEGVIKTEDFLTKYLPKEKKGIIKLKEISPESKSFREEIDKTVKIIKNNWVTLSFEDIFSLVNKNPFLANFYKTEDGEKHKKMLLEFKKSGCESMHNFVYDHKEDINNKLNEYINSYKYNYVEKEVFIGSK